MKTVLYRQWAPVQSAVHIEFPPDLIHDIRAQSPRDHHRGYLFGRREGNLARVLTALSDEQLRESEGDDPRIAGLEAIGIYAVRPRGEIFLTEADLEYLERIAGGVALVLAGGRAGFFAREANGSMQTVRSHEEFLLADAAPLAESPGTLVAPSPMPRGRHPARPPIRRWRWAAAATVLLSGPVALAYFHPFTAREPIELSLTEDSGHLILRWDPKETAGAGAYLEIRDADGPTRIPLPPRGGSATYAVRSGDVEILLASGGRSGRVHWTSARFIAQAQEEVALEYRTRVQTQEEVDQLQQQAAWLRQSIRRRYARVQELTAAADALLSR